MNDKLDISIFADEDGFYILQSKNTKDKLITKEMLDDDRVLAHYIREAIKGIQK